MSRIGIVSLAGKISRDRQGDGSEIQFSPYYDPADICTSSVQVTVYGVVDNISTSAGSNTGIFLDPGLTLYAPAGQYADEPGGYGANYWIWSGTSWDPTTYNCI